MQNMGISKTLQGKKWFDPKRAEKFEACSFLLGRRCSVCGGVNRPLFYLIVRLDTIIRRRYRRRAFRGFHQPTGADDTGRRWCSVVICRTEAFSQESHKAGLLFSSPGAGTTSLSSHSILSLIIGWIPAAVDLLGCDLTTENCLPFWW